jgi:small-conductance mechanosensitive channel/CRP-like cAMP-binding protein
MDTTPVMSEVFRGAVYTAAILAVGGVLVWLVTRRQSVRRLANPLFLLVITAAAGAFLRANPDLAGPPVTPYYRALVIFAFIYLAIKVGDLLLVDLLIARRRRFLPPSILRELISVILYAVAILVIMGKVLHINLMPLLATSAVLSLVAGLALQETLSNFFAGVTLATERPFTPGEWIKVGDQIGQVIEMGWRAVKIELYLKNDYLIVPNAVLAKERVVNFSRPVPVMGQEAFVNVHYRHPPNQVLAALLEAAHETKGLVAHPPPLARVYTYQDSSIQYLLRYWTADFEKLSTIQGMVLANIWYALRRHGLEIPFPIRTVHLHSVTEETERQAKSGELERRLLLLREVDFLRPLGEEGLARVAQSLKPFLYEAHRTVVRQGDEGDSFFLVSSGRVGVWANDSHSQTQLVATLGRGQCFGEMSLLTGARRSATVRAVEDSELLMLGKSEFRDILLANPKVMESLSEILSVRLEEYEATLARGRSAAAQAGSQDRARQLLFRIKAFFAI